MSSLSSQRRHLGPGSRRGWLLLPLLLWSGSAAALEDCSPYLQQIDARIEQARAQGENYDYALQLRTQISQMCAFVDASTLQQMVDSLDQLLPLMADFQAMMDEADARAIEHGPAGTARSDGPDEPPAAAPVPEIGSSLGGRLISRPDAMHQFGIWDLDLHEGRARVLYHTRPDRLQFARPDWELVTYVAEVDGSGEVVQRLIDRRQTSGQSALGLRPGADEILMQWQTGPQGRDALLERWSVRQQSLLSSVPAPAPAWAGAGMAPKAPFLAVTGRGNLLYAGTKPAPRDAVERTLAWLEASPEGEVLSRGSLTRPENLGLSWAGESGHGGAAGLLMVSALDDQGVDSRLQTPITRQVAERQIYANVHMEKRLFVIDGPSFWQSPALERMLQWNGEMSVPQNLPAAEMLRQSQAQMRMVAEVERSHGANRTVDSLNVGLQRVEMIRPLGSGRYVTLMTAVADRRLSPAVHGQYLYVFDQNNLQVLAYLEPLAAAAAVKFTALAASPAGQIYLLAKPIGGGQKRIYRVSGDGEVQGFARTDAGQDITLEGLVADDSGVWAFGRGLMDGIIGDRLWVERLQFTTP